MFSFLFKAIFFSYFSSFPPFTDSKYDDAPLFSDDCYTKLFKVVSLAIDCSISNKILSIFKSLFETHQVLQSEQTMEWSRFFLYDIDRRGFLAYIQLTLK